MRGTDLRFNKRIKLPAAIKEEHEVKMQMLKNNLKAATKLYADKAALTKFNNLTEAEQDGLSSLKSRVKEKDAIIYQTDKSGKFSIDSPENYSKACLEHVKDDNNATQTDHNEVEKLLNAH